MNLNFEDVNGYIEHMLEPLLENGEIALIDSRWLCGVDRIPPRQLLPKEAIISFKDMKDNIQKQWGSHVFTAYDFIVPISHMWLTPLHPDPYGTTLQTVHQKLQRLHNNFDGMCYGVLWDYMSLYQRVDPSNPETTFRSKRAV